MSIYDTLNKEQKEACFHTEGPVLILAGAGSGKTRVITHRIAYLMEECGVNPWNILAITFTNKAAGEMRERVDRLIGFGSESVWISTFHSMCVRILRRHINQIGYDSHFTIYDTDDQRALVKRIMRRLNIDEKIVRPRSVLAEISASKSELETAGQFIERHRNSYEELKTGQVYQEYERELRENNALDFDDLLVKTVELFNAHDEILEQYQARFRYIMVDEYQDTNRAQFEIVRRLAEGYRNLCVVGDDDQSIYKFRGADIRNILDFEKNYRDAFVVRLEQNYRSTQNILDAANAVIANNHGRKVKNLWTDRGAGEKVHFRELFSGRAEAVFIAGDIARSMKENRKLTYQDFAVLYRTNAQSRQIEEEFVQRSIPYNVVGGHNFYDRMEVRDILGYLRTISNPQDDISVQRIINVPRRGIGQATIDRVDAAALQEGIHFYDVLGNLDRFPDLARAKKKVQPFVKLIQDLRDYAETHSVEDLIQKVVEETDYEVWLEGYDEETAEDRMENISELISKAVTYEQEAQESDDGEGPSLAGFLEEVSLVADIDQVGDSDNRVLLMTLHSAKGLEFPHVYLAGMEENVFPSYQACENELDGDEENMEEERRLAYVGMTRAMDVLTLTAAAGRVIYNELRHNEISRFVDEIPDRVLDRNDVFDSDPGGEDFGEDDSDEDMPWNRSSRAGGRLPYGTWRPGTGVIGQGAGSVYRQTVTGAGQNRTSTDKHPAARPSARYVPPHTAPDKKPYLAGKTGLDSLQKGIPAGMKPDYEEGDRVRHVKYGTGTVLSIEKGPKDYKVKVDFGDAGVRTMYAAFAKLEKV